MSVPFLDPALTTPLARLLEGLHDLGLAWVPSLVAVVVVLRLLQLPLTLHQVRQQRARAAARDDLRALAHRYRRRSDPASQRRRLEEQRTVLRSHGVRSWGCLVLLLPVPLWLALYHLVSQLAAGSVAAGVSTAVVASFAGATLAGVPLAARGWSGDLTHLAVVLGLALTSAMLGFLTQRAAAAGTPLADDAPAAVLHLQQWLPAVSAVGVVAAAGAVPVALLVCWVANAAWQALQQGVLTRASAAIS
ncbi:YidC/Oxa1 family membrane protein insertase [Nocardioides sp.]|uniref:YidC/Oxa1 family membrane protein insertase n=1 Tax=Nocardioides sp. TaxID=35761 RepID=UPI0035188217